MKMRAARLLLDARRKNVDYRVLVGLHLAMPEDLQQQFDVELLNLYEKWNTELGYRAARFYQMISPHCKRYCGGVQAARSIIVKNTIGFTALIERADGI